MRTETAVRAALTDDEMVSVVTKLFRRAQAGEFGRVGGLKPGVNIKTSPFAVEIGNLYLGRLKAIAVAEGRLTVEPRALGWVLVGENPKRAPVPKLKRGEGLKAYLEARTVARLNRKPVRSSRRRTQEQRRAEYLREVGRDMILRKEA
jgi:hypothetical protein